MILYIIKMMLQKTCLVAKIDTVENEPRFANSFGKMLPNSWQNIFWISGKLQFLHTRRFEEGDTFFENRLSIVVVKLGLPDRTEGPLLWRLPVWNGQKRSRPARRERHAVSRSEEDLSPPQHFDALSAQRIMPKKRTKSRSVFADDCEMILRRCYSSGWSDEYLAAKHTRATICFCNPTIGDVIDFRALHKGLNMLFFYLQIWRIRKCKNT